jgi:quinol-cytochrome oxidoreductase complex cytochrome b subunit
MPKGWPRRVLVTLGIVATALLAVLLVTGVWLWQNYRPTPQGGWNEPTMSSAVQSVNRFHIVHHVASNALEVVLAAIVVLVVVIPALRRWWPGIVGGVALAAVAVATGPVLAWSGISVWEITTGEGISGVDAAFPSGVRSVFTGDGEISPGTFRIYAYAHVLPLAVAAVVVGVLMARRRLARVDDQTATGEPQPLEIPLT